MAKTTNRQSSAQESLYLDDFEAQKDHEVHQNEIHYVFKKNKMASETNSEKILKRFKQVLVSEKVHKGDQ